LTLVDRLMASVSLGSVFFFAGRLDTFPKSGRYVVTIFVLHNVVLLLLEMYRRATSGRTCNVSKLEQSMRGIRGLVSFVEVICGVRSIIISLMGE